MWAVVSKPFLAAFKRPFGKKFTVVKAVYNTEKEAQEHLHSDMFRNLLKIEKVDGKNNLLVLVDTRENKKETKK